MMCALGNAVAQGNVEVSPDVVTWIVDTQPPSTNATLRTRAVTNDPIVVVDVSCAGELRPDLCSVCYSASGALLTTTTCVVNTTLRFPYSRDGDVVLQLAAKDGGGNIDPNPVRLQWTWVRGVALSYAKSCVVKRLCFCYRALVRVAISP